MVTKSVLVALSSLWVGAMVRTAATPGTWRVDYSTDDGLRGAMDFTIGPDFADVQGRIDLARR